MCVCVFGVYHSKEQFVSVARQIWHPFDELRNVPDRLILCLFELLTLGPVEIAKLRLAKLKKWRLWAAELEKEETLLKQRLHPSVERIVRPKRLLLLHRIADEIGWPDAKLHDELEQGFKLTGMASASGVFRPDPRPASLSEEELYSKAKFLKPLLLGKISAQKVDDLAAAVYELTCDEAADAKGWLDGPYTPAQIDEKLGTQTWIPLRRFGVSQKDKIRPVDDCSENNVNDAFTSVESISLGAMDHIVWSA